MTDAQRPRTEAGRALAAYFIDGGYPEVEAILAIEAEASLAAPAGLRAFDWDQAEPALIEAFTDVIADNPPENAAMVTVEWAFETLTALSDRGYVLSAFEVAPRSPEPASVPAEGHPFTCAYCRDDGIIGPGSEFPTHALFTHHMAVSHPGLPFEKPLAASPETPEAGIDALRALSEAATPGPWVHDGLDAFDEFPSEISAVIDGPDGLLASLPSGVFQQAGDRYNVRQWAAARDSDSYRDAAFIVAAVNYVRARLASREEGER